MHVNKRSKKYFSYTCIMKVAVCCIVGDMILNHRENFTRIHLHILKHIIKQTAFHFRLIKMYDSARSFIHVLLNLYGNFMLRRFILKICIRVIRVVLQATHIVLNHLNQLNVLWFPFKRIFVSSSCECRPQMT